MSPSTARTAVPSNDTTWTDPEWDLHAKITGIAPGKIPTTGERLRALRQRLNDPVLAERPHRQRKVAGYLQALPGQATADVEATLRMDADRRGWDMTKVFIDPVGTLPPVRRDEWLLARKYVYEGYADGLVVLDRRHISADEHEYIAELEFVCGRWGFVALVVPETDV